ncbi:MAG TPA: choline kinase family protein [Oscillospiraceae bacterium]|nr:choline kinase family protein [Oscillospiraceae bacterium]
MDNESVKNFWSILKADEIGDFMDLLNLAEKILKRKVANIEILAGGLTNKSFKVVFEDGLTVAMRIAGRGTGEYISRQAEKHNSTMAAGMGIAPEVYYFDPDTGSQLVEFVKLPTLHIEDFQKNPDVLKNSAQIMNTLHSSGIKFLGAFDPVAGIEDYVTILKQKKFEDRYEGWDSIYKTVLRVRDAYAKNPPALTPCHNDTLAENFMYDGKTMKLIDWEYGGMGDPYYDASGIFTENLLSDEAGEIFMRAYFGGEPTDEQRARILVSEFLYCTYWSVWSLVQIANGKDRDLYWQYGLDRAILGKEYMSNPNFERYLKLIG